MSGLNIPIIALLKTTVFGTVTMDLLLKYLLYKYKHLSSDLQCPHIKNNLSVVEHEYKPSFGKTETRDSWSWLV